MKFKRYCASTAFLWWERAANRASAVLLTGAIRFVPLAASVLACQPAAAVEFEPAFLLRAAHSLVRVEADRPPRGIQIGTGVVIAPETVATACHVIRDAVTVSILYTGRRWKMSALHAMPERDVCVFSVPSLDAPPARLRNAGELQIGESVAAVGFGGGAGIQWSEGMVEKLHRFDGGEIVQTSAAFTLGASGGALFDTRGRVFGVLSFGMRGKDPQFYCVPIEWAVQETIHGDSGRSVDTRFNASPFWEREVEALPFFMRASTLESEQRWEDLSALCEAWRLVEPYSAEPAYIRSAIHTHFGRLIAARYALEEATRLDSQHALAWSALVRVRLRLHDLGGAQDAYSRLVALNARLARALLADEVALQRQVDE
ncbi:MAG: trypsin-like peptidase domain-containing protein [Burkholderiales bacterium]